VTSTNCCEFLVHVDHQSVVKRSLGSVASKSNRLGGSGSGILPNQRESRVGNVPRIVLQALEGLARTSDLEGLRGLEEMIMSSQ
jgi:hypothetical protein